MNLTRHNRPFWWFTFSAVFFLVVSQLIQEGAFMDGMLYVSVSKNLADGIGTFWDPHFCKTYHSSFHEQPPLYFGLLAVFYKLFGASMYVERLFCFCCFVLTGLYIHKLWKKIAGTSASVAGNSWLPVFYWTIIPICFWAYTNLVEEVVMSLFALMSVYYIFLALFLNQKVLFNLCIAGICIFLTFLTKGVQGLFPVVAAGAYWLVTRNIRFGKMLLYTSVLIGVPVLIYFSIVSSIPEAAISFQKYFHGRLIGTFSNKNATTDNRFFLLSRLISHLFPLVLLSILIRWGIKRKQVLRETNNPNNAVIYWLLLIGLAGSLPLMVTLEQRSFYLVTSMPMFAIAIALWTEPYLAGAIEKIDVQQRSFSVWRVVSSVLFVASLIFSGLQIGKAKRDGAMLQDVYAFGKLIPHGDIIGIPQPMCYDFNFKEYMVRYYYVSSDDAYGTSHTYYACRKDLLNQVPAGYTRVALETKEYDLFKLNQ